MRLRSQPRSAMHDAPRSWIGDHFVDVRGLMAHGLGFTAGILMGERHT